MVLIMMDLFKTSLTPFVGKSLLHTFPHPKYSCGDLLK